MVLPLLMLVVLFCTMPTWVAVALLVALALLSPITLSSMQATLLLKVLALPALHSPTTPTLGGIFGSGSQSYIAQLSYLSDGVFDGALVYANGMTNAGATETDTYGALVSFDFGGFIIGGYYAQHDVNALRRQQR
jgi:hypothetical protein